MNYDEFRVELSPNLQTPGDWNVHLVECPIQGLAGSKGTVTPNFKRAQLRRLRNRNGWPNLAELRAIGKNVWHDLMTPTLEAAYEACLVTSTAQNRGLRLCVVLLGQGKSALGPDGLWPSEMPVEALYHDNHDFLATTVAAPISRSLQSRADKPPHKATYPLRMLVAVAAPTDKPAAKVADEVASLRKALADLSVPAGALVLDICENATKQELRDRLSERPYHILHFIGHGGFGAVGDADLTSRAHLCLLRDDEPLSDPLDASTLSMLLRDTEVRLVVMTACSSASATPANPDEDLYQTGAFDGLAQRLLSGVSGVTAVVAMQFDMEDKAALAFTQSFYQRLLEPGRSLDEVVTHSRKDVALKMDIGHRAWVNPVIYWRCEDGLVFELDPVFSSELDDDALQEIDAIQRERQVYLRILDDMNREPPTIRPLLANQIARFQKDVQALEDQLAELLGESLRLRGGRAKPNKEIVCPLTLRLLSPGVIDLVQLEIDYPHAQLTFVACEAGKHAPGNPPVVQMVNPGKLRLVVPAPSGGQQWKASEYELGLLKFTVAAGPAASLTHLKVTNPMVRRAGAAVAVKTLDGVVFHEAGV